MEQVEEAIGRGDFETALLNCDTALKQENADVVGLLAKRVQILENLKRYEDALVDICSIARDYPTTRKFKNDKTLNEAKNRIFDKLSLLDVEDLIDFTTEVSGKKIITKTQLKNREKKEFHDTWELVDYFNVETNNVCPPELFAPDEQELTEIGENTTSDLLHLTVQKHSPIAINLHHQFAQGSHRTFGLTSVAFAQSLLTYLQKFNSENGRKKIPFFKTLNKKVNSFGLRRGVVRVVTTNWFAIGVGGAIIRDYDDHNWTVFILEDDSEVNVDFLAAQFGFFTYHVDNGLPLHIFDERVLLDENHAKIYRVKENILVNMDQIESQNKQIIDQDRFLAGNKMDKKARELLHDIEGSIDKVLQ
jgi:hypothetical protein